MHLDRSLRVDDVARYPRFVWSAPAQMVVLALATVAAYYHAFFDVARADQLIYLNQTIGKDLWALTVGAYDLNRSVGDFLLFRPVLYVLLGIERWAFGYHFVLWQATGIGLHIGVVLSLFAYFRRRLGRLPSAQPSATPFVLALYFALLFAGTEMVAWHHIVGYLVFCLLLVQGALAYQRLVTTPAAGHGVALVASIGLACFTYELGNVAALVFAAMLFFLYGRRRTPEAAAGRGVVLASALMLIAAPCGYALWSWLDYRHMSGAAEPAPPLDAARFVVGVVISAGYWLAASLWPAATHLVPGARIQAARPFPLLSGLSVLNFAFCLTAAWATGLFALRRRIRELAADILPAAGFLLLAASYTAIIVIGRSLQRGIIPTLSINSYYAYIFALLWLPAFFHIVLVPAEAAHAPRELRRRRLLLVSLTAIAVIGGIRIFAVHAAMHRQYSGPIGAVVDHVQALREQHGGAPDFSFEIAADCPAAVDIPWFAPYAREKRARHTIPDVLFPDAARSEGAKYTVGCR